MDNTAKFLCEGIMGVQFAYVQSDEISIVLTDFAKHTTQAWYDGNIQKIASVSASFATGHFNKLRAKRGVKDIAFFDSRAFVIPDRNEVANYFVWRQKDCVRNSITMAAQSVYSHSELHGKSGSDKQDMLHAKGINWNDYPARCKRGGFVDKDRYKETRSSELHSADFTSQGIGMVGTVSNYVMRSRWVVTEPPTFTKDQSFLLSRIPQIQQGDEA